MVKVSRLRVGFQVLLHAVLIGHVVAYYWLEWRAVGALDFQSFFHHFLGRGILTAGALLTMLCDTMLPEAFEELRDWTGALVVLGFAGSIALSAL